MKYEEPEEEHVVSDEEAEETLNSILEDNAKQQVPGRAPEGLTLG